MICANQIAASVKFSLPVDGQDHLDRRLTFYGEREGKSGRERAQSSAKISPSKGGRERKRLKFEGKCGKAHGVVEEEGIAGRGQKGAPRQLPVLRLNLMHSKFKKMRGKYWGIRALHLRA